MESEELKREISRIVDKWVSEVLKDRFLEKPSGVPDRSLWDKLKQGMTNWWWGPKGDKWNPYVWQNRFGDELGVAESFNPSVFTLQAYKDLKSLVDSVESNLNEAREDFNKLRLMTVIKSAAERLKEMLFQALNGRVERRPSPAPVQRGPEVSDVGSNPTSSEPPKSPPATSVISGSRTSKKPVVDIDRDDQDGSLSPSQSPSASASPPPPPPPPPPAAQPSPPPNQEPSVEPSSRTQRKTNRMKIEEAADDIKEIDRSKLRPEKDWIGGDGNIKKEKIAYVLAWMGMKPHLDPLDDETIKKELADSLGKDVGLGIPGSGGGTMRKYLVRTLESSFDQVMKKIGVETEAVAKPATVEKKTNDRDAERAKGGGLEKQRDDKTDTVVDEDNNSELKGYLYKGDKKRTREEVISLVFAFVEHSIKDLDKQKAKRMKVWYRSEAHKFESVIHADDQLDYLESCIVNTDTYINSISDAIGLDKSAVKKKMADFIDKKDNTV